MRQTDVGSCKLERRMHPHLHGQDTRSAGRFEERVERGSKAAGKSRIASALPSLVQELVLLGQIALQQEDAVTACSLLEASATLAMQIQEEQNGAEPTSLPAWVLALQGNAAEASILPEERLVQSRKGDDREAIVSGLAKAGGVATQRRVLMPKLTSRTLELVPAPKASVGSSVGLSAREVEVLRLVAQGLTDAQVAEQLVISPRTVNWHLSAIYSKLGVSCRSAATRYALEQQVM